MIPLTFRIVKFIKTGSKSVVARVLESMEQVVTA